MKATHKGHCQACGRLQMLPKGVLSKHGYNVTHGFFSGVCVGAGYLPFEKSCALVARFVANAKASLEALEAFQAKLRETATANEAWFNCYNWQADWRMRRSWKLCKVTEIVVPFHDGSGQYSKFTRTGDVERNGQHKDADVSADYRATLTEVCTKANANYAEWLEHESVSLRRYIAWQEERVRTWEEKLLLARDREPDHDGFEPTKPAW